MSEGDFCNPDWQPNSTINQFIDGFEYGLVAPFMEETMDEYSRRRTGERQQDWNKEKEICLEVDRAVQRELHRALTMAITERVLANTQRFISEKGTGGGWGPRRDRYYDPQEVARDEREKRIPNGLVEAFRNADSGDFKGMKPDPRQERKEEDFFKLYD